MDPGVPGGQGIGGLPGHGLAAGTPLRSGEKERMGMSPYAMAPGMAPVRDDLPPRVLEPINGATPVGPLGTVNPFWSTLQHSTGCKR